TRDNAVYAVEGETAFAGKRNGVARGETEGAGRRAPRGAADAEKRGVPERQRDDGGREVLFVAVLVQAHARAGVVEIDEAGLRRGRARGDRRKGCEQPRRHRRPGAPGFGVRRLIAIASLLRDPAERAAIAHHDRERLAR